MTKTDRKSLDIIQHRIGACDILLDFLHDDVPWSEQQPLMDLLCTLKNHLEKKEDAIPNE